MRSERGIAGAKSRPGFAVPDSVHHLKLASPWRLPRRWTVTLAIVSPGWTSTVSAAISMRIGPAAAARADASLMVGRVDESALRLDGATEGAAGSGAGIGFARAAGAVRTTGADGAGAACRAAGAGAAGLVATGGTDALGTDAVGTDAVGTDVVGAEPAWPSVELTRLVQSLM